MAGKDTNTPEATFYWIRNQVDVLLLSYRQAKWDSGDGDNLAEDNILFFTEVQH